MLQDLEVHGRNVDTALKEFNQAVLTAVKEAIPRGVTKNYNTFWNDKLQEAEENLNRAREEAEEHPGDESNICL